MNDSLSPWISSRGPINAVAYLRVGHQIREIYIHPYDGFTDPLDQEAHRDPNYPFVVYAGPWAHADTKASTDGAPTFESVTAEMQANLSDWRAYEETMPGRDVTKVEQVEIAMANAYYDETKNERDIAYPPIAPPRECWNDALAEMGPKIKQLADELLAAEESRGGEHEFLEGELPLVRVASHFWRRQEDAHFPRDVGVLRPCLCGRGCSVPADDGGE
jgi:hypothetical protein